jgi:hypothetical protein
LDAVCNALEEQIAEAKGTHRLKPPSISQKSLTSLHPFS